MVALAVAMSLGMGGVAYAQSKCKPPTVLHNGSCVHPDDLEQPAPEPTPAPRPVPPPVVKPPPPPSPSPSPEPQPEPEPQPDPEPTVMPDPIPEPDPIVDPEPETGDTGSSDTSGMTIGGFVLIGVGAASLVVTAITGAMVLDRKSTVDDPEHCDPEGTCDAEGLEAADDGKTLSAVSTATFVIGLAAIATGIALVVFDDDETSTALAIGPGHVSLRGTF